MACRPPIYTNTPPLVQLEIPPPSTTGGLYYIMVDSVPVVRPVDLRNHVNRVCNVDRVELYEVKGQSCHGWVRVRGFDAFQKAVAHLEKNPFRGRVMKISGSNDGNRIILKANPDDFQRVHNRPPTLVDSSPAPPTFYANNPGGQYLNSEEYYTGAGNQSFPENLSYPAYSHYAADPYGAAYQPSTGNHYDHSQFAQDFAATSIMGTSVTAQNYRAPRLFVTIRGIPGTRFSRKGLRDVAQDIIKKYASGLESQIVEVQCHLDERKYPDGPIRVRFPDEASARQVVKVIHGKEYTVKKEAFEVQAELSTVGYGERAYKEAKEAKRQWEIARAASAATDAALTAGPSMLPANLPALPYAQAPSQPPLIADGSIKPHKGKEKATSGHSEGSNSRGRKK